MSQYNVCLYRNRIVSIIRCVYTWIYTFSFHASMRYIFVSLYLLSCVCIPVWGNDVLEMMRNQNVDNVVDIPQEYIYENPMITYPDDDIQVDVW